MIIRLSGAAGPELDIEDDISLIEDCYTEPAAGTGAVTGAAGAGASHGAATMGEQNALDSALSYLKYSAFSYTGLIDQLEYEGFTYDQAVYGVE